MTPEAPISAPHWVRRSIDQDDLIASVDRVTNVLAECLSLAESILDRSTKVDQIPALQGHHATNAEHLARAQCPRWQDEDLVITTTLDGRNVQRQPLPAQTKSMPRPHCFGLVGEDPICRDALDHLFGDHAEHSHVTDLYQINLLEANQPAPTVNMVQI